MFSVVIPLYNKSHTISRTLNSVLVQTFMEFEIVIVNDGSTDDGVQKIIELTSDDRIKIINQENQGVSVARNNGVKNSKFEYVAFLDGDDEWFPSYLENIKNAIFSFPKAGMYCSAGIVKNADGSEYYRLADKYKNTICEISFFENPHVFLHTSSTVVSKKAFDQTDGFPLKMQPQEDFALFFSLALKFQVIYCGKISSIYNGGVDGQATSINLDSMTNHFINRMNIVFNIWIKSELKNKLYLVFTKYELRHTLYNDLKKSNYNSINSILINLDSRLISHFLKLELFIIKKPSTRFLAMIYLLFTKLIWRLNGFPRTKFIYTESSGSKK